MAYADEVLADSPWAYWPFNDASGATVNDVVGSNDLTLAGGTYGRDQDALAPGLGKSTSFNNDGDTASGTLTGNAMDGAWTLEVWIRAINWYGGQADGLFQVGNVGGGSDGDWTWRHSDGGGRPEGEFQVVRTASSTPLATSAQSVNNRVNHMVLTYDGSSVLKMYRNGVEIGSATGVADVNPGNAAFKWNWAFNNERTTQGHFSDAAIYPSALSLARIQAHYDAAFPGYAGQVLKDNPRIYWTMGEASGATATNAAFGSGLDGTLSGTYARDETTLPNGDKATRISGAGYTHKVETTFAAYTPAAISIEYWVKPYVLYDFSCYVNDWDTQGMMHLTALGGFGAGEYYTRKGAGDNNPPKAWFDAMHGLYRDVVRTGEWTHMVYTTDGSVARLYRNGKELSFIPFNAPDPLSSTSFSVKYGDMAIGHVAQYDSVLSAERVEAHYNAMVTPATGFRLIGAGTSESYGGAMVWPFPRGTQAGDLVLVLTENDTITNEYLSLTADGLTETFATQINTFYAGYYGTVTPAHIANGGLTPKRRSDNSTPESSRYSAYAIAVFRDAQVVDPLDANNNTVTSTAADQRVVSMLVGLQSGDLLDGWNKTATDALSPVALTPSGQYGCGVVFEGPITSGASFTGFPAYNWEPGSDQPAYALVGAWIVEEAVPPPPPVPTPAWQRVKRPQVRRALSRAIQ